MRQPECSPTETRWPSDGLNEPRSLVVGLYQPLADGSGCLSHGTLTATRPNLPSAVASEDKEKRRSMLPIGGFLWLLGVALLLNNDAKTRPPQSTKRPAVENRQPSHSALKLT